MCCAAMIPWSIGLFVFAPQLLQLFTDSPEVIEAGVQTYGYFGLDGTFAFNAWYGFAVCVVMVGAAKVFGAFLKREDAYYDGD